MHAPVIVLGDDPIARVENLHTPMGEVDWAAIGGRYTGSLPPLPGATTGKVYGDAVPAIEAWFAKISTEAGANGSRPGAAQGDGVDQIIRGELDLGPVYPPMRTPAYMLDQHDMLHGPEFSAADEGISMAVSYARATGATLDVDPREIERVQAKGQHWCERCWTLLASAPPDTLVTVVDTHL